MYVTQWLLILLCAIIILGSGGVVHAGAEDFIKGEKGNYSPVIFSFSAANPVPEKVLNYTINATDRYAHNKSVEARYNTISSKTDTSLPRLVLLGIPMECHFCLIYRLYT